MSNSVKVVDQSHQSESNNNESQTKENDEASQFIVKRTDPSDIYYFTDPITRGDTESSKLTLEFNQFFNLNDIEMGYENSTFSITVMIIIQLLVFLFLIILLLLLLKLKILIIKFLIILVYGKIGFIKISMKKKLMDKILYG